MSSFPSIVPLLLSVALYTSLVKLAAFLYKRALLSWRNACIFSLILLVVLGLGTLANRLSGNAVPLVLLVAFGLVIQVALGAWFLASRARSATGGPLGSKDGAIVALIAYALTVSLGVAAGTLLTVLHP